LSGKKWSFYSGRVSWTGTPQVWQH
jgi:hypothetical protein